MVPWTLEIPEGSLELNLQTPQTLGGPPAGHLATPGQP